MSGAKTDRPPRTVARLGSLRQDLTESLVRQALRRPTRFAFAAASGGRDRRRLAELAPAGLRAEA
jgi:hypothetical protein